MESSEVEPVKEDYVEKLTTIEFLSKGSASASQSQPPDVITRRKNSKRTSSVRQTAATSAYDVEVSDLASNTLALFHNALRHEIVTYTSFAVPVLATHVPLENLDDTVNDLLDRWAMLARFMVLVSRIEEVVCATVFREVNVGFRREALAVERAHKAIKERLNYGFELFVRATTRASTALEKNPSANSLEKFGLATEAQIKFAEDTAKKCEDFVVSVDKLGDAPLRYPHLEREVWNTLQKVCRHENFGFTAVQLFRWSKNENYLVRWMSRNTSSGEVLMKKVQEWVKVYTERDEQHDLEVSRDKVREDIERDNAARNATKEFSRPSSNEGPSN